MFYSMYFHPLIDSTIECSVPLRQCAWCLNVVLILQGLHKMGDIQEMSFQNVVDTILKPQGIKVGGYPDELFLDMSEKDRERWQCNIW